jgi:hypothetical protein
MGGQQVGEAVSKGQGGRRRVKGRGRPGGGQQPGGGQGEGVGRVGNEAWWEGRR